MNSHTLWYMTRATGIVALVLLTATTVIGTLTSVRLSTPAWPRFAWQDLHRRLSLLAVVFVGLHVATTVADGYAPIGWLSAVVPFTSPYRRLWLGLGTVAVDLLLAVGISSMLRSRIRPVTWRALHWLAYASWPIAVVHAFGTGTDPRLHWVLLLVVLCTMAVLASVAWRIGSGWPRRARLRIGAGALGALSIVTTGTWAAAGPLRTGWAAKAGTPASLLGRTSAPSSAPTPAASPAGAAGASSAAPAGSLPALPFEAGLSGTITQHALGNGRVEVDITAATTGGVAAVLGIRLIGVPDGSGGIVMQSGSAGFGPRSSTGQYQGQVVGLEGSQLTLALSDAAGGRIELRVDLSIAGTAVSGTLSAQSGGASGEGGDR